jgi:C_GCAxxG_C_C family probable redox protein
MAMFQGGRQCAQSVLVAFSGSTGLPVETALRLATPLGAGCGRRSLTCGAVTGALLVIGLKTGERDAIDLEAREETYRLVNEFSRRFVEKNGSVNCGELLGLDLATEAGRALMVEKDYRSSRCAKFVLDAGLVLEAMGF